MDYAALKTELQSDPTAKGYAPLLQTQEWGQVAALLNARNAGTIRRTRISKQDIVEAILVTDFTALASNPTAAALSSERRYLAWLATLVSLESVRLLNADGTDTPIVANLKAMFPDGSGTRTRLIALAQRTGSRAETISLVPEDGVVSADDVMNAYLGDW